MRKRATNEHAGELPPFLVAASLKDYISNDLRTMVSSPHKYRDPRGGPIRIGFEATLLPKVCEVWLEARAADALTTIQKPVAERAEILMRGLAQIGIIALVDEATGYQRDRAKDALARILEAFIAKELQLWLKTFPADFYQEMFRLRGMEYPNATCAVERRDFPVGDKPTRQLSLQPVAIGAVVEVTKRLKPSVQRVTLVTRRACGLQRVVNAEQAPKRVMWKPTRTSQRGRLLSLGK